MTAENALDEFHDLCVTISRFELKHVVPPTFPSPLVDAEGVEHSVVSGVPRFIRNNEDRREVTDFRQECHQELSDLQPRVISDLVNAGYRPAEAERATTPVFEAAMDLLQWERQFSSPTVLGQLEFGQDAAKAHAERAVGDLVAKLTNELLNLRPMATALIASSRSFSRSEGDEPAAEAETVEVPVPVAESALVRLFDRNDAPIVNENTKQKLTNAQYDVVLALLNADGRGLTKDDLDRLSGHGDARKILYRLVHADSDWAAAIPLPRKTGRGYRIC